AECLSRPNHRSIGPWSYPSTAERASDGLALASSSSEDLFRGEAPPHGIEQAARLERFAEERDRPEPERLGLHVHVVDAARQDDGQSAEAVAERGVQLETAHPAQVHVGDEAAARNVQIVSQKFLGRRERADEPPGAPKQSLERAEHRRVVVDDKDGRRGRHASAPFHAGRVKENVAPRSALLTPERCPPCAATIDWQMTSPRPRPCGFVVKNGSNTRSLPSAGRPGPRSAIATRTAAGSSNEVVMAIRRSDGTPSRIASHA